MTVAQEFEQEIAGWVNGAVAETLDEGGRERLEKALTNWLSFTARKKPMLDLPRRLEDFCKRIRTLAESVRFEMTQDGIVVKAAGDAEVTLRMLERGTDWFDPARDVTEMIVNAVFEQRI
jgi:hypothetical protein